MNPSKLIEYSILTSNKKISKKRKYFRTKVAKLVVFLERLLSKLSPLYSVAGSYRRKRKFIKDLDFVVADTTAQKIIRLLNKVSSAKSGFVLISTLWKGNKKLAIECSYKDIPSIQVEFRLCNKKNFGSQLLMATGNKEFNIYMRIKARNKGLKLNEYGLWKDNTLIASKTEQDIFTALGLEYVDPELRE